MPGLLLCACLLCSGRAAAQGTGSRETLIKAAFLLKFPLYVAWPQNAFEDVDSPVVIGVLKNGSTGKILQRQAAQTTAKGRKVVVHQFDSLDQYTPCHVLFVPRSVGAKTRTAAIARTRGSPVLVVGETSGFAAAGGVVNFFIDADNTVGFEVNRDAAVGRGLRVDARLLSIARIVRTRQPDRNE